MRRAHDSGMRDEDFPEDEFVQKFGLFERTLGNLIGGFFVSVEELDEILEDTNN